MIHDSWKKQGFVHDAGILWMHCLWGIKKFWSEKMNGGWFFIPAYVYFWFTIAQPPKTSESNNNQQSCMVSIVIVSNRAIMIHRHPFLKRRRFTTTDATMRWKASDREIPRRIYRFFVPGTSFPDVGNLVLHGSKHASFRHADRNFVPYS